MPGNNNTRRRKDYCSHCSFTIDISRSRGPEKQTCKQSLTFSQPFSLLVVSSDHLRQTQHRQPCVFCVVPLHSCQTCCFNSAPAAKGDGSSKIFLATASSPSHFLSEMRTKLIGPPLSRCVRDPDFRTRIRQDSAHFEPTGSDQDYGFYSSFRIRIRIFKIHFWNLTPTQS